MLRRAIEEAGSVCRRMLWAVWQEAQVAVTTSPFFSRPSVHAFRIVLQDVGFVDLALALHGRAFLVALAAHEGHALRVDGGARVARRHDVVAAVAVGAARRQRVATGHGLAVQRLTVLLLLVGVAGAAVHTRRVFLVRELGLLQVRVAGYAGKLAVNRGGIALLIDESGNRLALARGLQRLVAVAAQAVFRSLSGEKGRE